MVDSIFITLTRLLVAALIVSAVAGTVGVLVGRYAFPHRPDAEEAYYRAIFDACSVGTGGGVGNCLTATRGAFGREWFHQASPGWEWPLPEVLDGDDNARLEK